MGLAQRVYADDLTRELFGLAAELADKELRPTAATAERDGVFPRELFRTLGAAGLLGLPYPERLGGGGQPHEVYLQVVEELAGAWLTVGLGLSVHTLACFPLAVAGTAAQQQAWLPELLGGGMLGAYCLSEPQSGSDAAALRTRAVADGADYVIDGVKSWISHAGQADFYTLFARTSGEHDGPDPARGISCLHVPAETPAASASPRAPPAWPRQRWTPRSATRVAGASSGGASPTSRACPSCSLTWPRRWRQPAPSTSPPPGARMPGCPTARRPPWPSCSPATLPCGSPPTRSRYSADMATSRTSRPSGTCARPRRCRSSRAPTRSSGW